MSRKAALQVAAARVRGTGDRVTQPRVQVLAALLDRGAAMTHHEIEEALGPGSVDRVTLYRVLDWLVRHGLVHKFTGADRAWRFSTAERRHDAHAHFHCNRCGNVVCLEDVRTRRSVSLPRGFHADGVEVTVKGVCAACG